MDPTILQLFTADEILDRIGYRRSTGCLHIFTQRESANIFFKEGVAVAAAKGLLEGEDVLKQILEWKEARHIWQPDIPVPTPPLKILQINIRDFIARQKTSGKTPSEISSSPKSLSPEATPHVIPVPSKSVSTNPAPLPAAPAASPVPVPNSAPKPSDPTAPVQLTATRNINQSLQVRSAQEEALLNKHKLTLVSVDDPAQRLKISRVSCLIGRNPACDISLNHGSISRQHCLLQITDRGLHVKDLNTTNGTKVNGIGMTEGYINVGDKLGMGHLVYILEKDKT